MPEAADFKLVELREKAKARGLVIGGTKAEIIARLMENDPAGKWMENDGGREIEDSGGREDVRGATGGIEGSGRQESSQFSAHERELVDREREFDRSRREREIEFGRRERELMQRELEIARCEIASLRQGAGAVAAEEGSRTPELHERRSDMADTSRPLLNMNLKTIAELVSEFDGTPDNFDVWRKQVEFMKVTYELADDVAKTLIGMKVKKKAFEWLHSRAEHLAMTFNELMGELERMYRPKQKKIDLRKKFEARIWMKGESFREYAHDKIIMGNRVPVDDDDMLDYLVEGIPDRALCNQARIQCFATRESLIDAFDKIMLREQPSVKQAQPEKRGALSSKFVRGGKDASGGKDESSDDKRKTNRKGCYNCGLSGHVSAACPSKEMGPKCYNCSEHGHTASKCPKKNETTKEVNEVTRVTRKTYAKTVTIMGEDINALIDTGSDLTLMCKDEYMRIGSPPLQPTKTRFEGWASPACTALGKFQTEIIIDGFHFQIRIHVYADKVSRHRFLIGSDFLESRNFRGKGGAIYFDPDDGMENPAEIMQIDVHDEENAVGVDLSHIEDEDARKQIAELVRDYKPNKMTETTVSMRLVLKDNEAVYQKARRLSPNERDIVNAQIEEWKNQGIIRPSSSEYASPVVLTGKKDGTHRLCVDYRLLNKKVVRD